VGYVVGFGHGEGSRPAPELAEAPPPAPAQDEVRLPDSLLMPAEEEKPEPPSAAVRETPKETPRVVEMPPPAKPTPASSAPTPPQKPASATGAAPVTPAPSPTTPPTPRPAAPSTAAATGYNVQVSALRVAADANNVVNNLRQKGYPAHVEADRGDGWHRVLVGPFASREAAQESRNRLTTDGFNTILRAP
jgi:cell division septation protein DedD